MQEDNIDFYIKPNEYELFFNLIFNFKSRHIPKRNQR